MERTRVAGADDTWRQMDSPVNPMMITGLLVFDGLLTFEETVAMLSERLVDRYPKFSSRVRVDAAGRAWWEPVPHHDVAAHVHRLAVPEPGGEEGLLTLVSQRLSERLDPDRPLWHVDLVEDVDGRSAILFRLHHVLADGISLARVLLQLADGSSDRPVDVDHGVLATAQRLAREAWSYGSTWLSEPERWLQAARTGMDGVVEVGHLVAMPADPPSALKGTLGVRKAVAWMPPLSLARIKAIGHPHGATINDVLMTALALALRSYLVDRGTPVPALRTFVPFNLRPLDRPIPRDLGNQFGLVVLELSLVEADPIACLADTKARMDVLKQSTEPVVTYALLQALAEVPHVVERGLVDFFGSKCSLITTNVPGPRAPLFMQGHRVHDIMFWVPQSAAVSLGVSILSYCGRVRMGVASDAGLVPDPGAIARAFTEAVDALEAG